jgi:transposase
MLRKKQKIQVCLNDAERVKLRGIAQHRLSHYKLNCKIAKILLKADHDANNINIVEIADEIGYTKKTVTKIIRSYRDKGLDGILKQQPTFYFKLRKKDRIQLQNLLKQNVTYSWNYDHAKILLTADSVGKNSKSCEIILEDVVKQMGTSRQTVRKVCNQYMSAGLENVLNVTAHRSLTPFRNYPIKLNSKERSWLKNIIETTKRQSIRRRALILLNADENGLNLHNSDIIERVGTNLGTIRLVCQRYAERGIDDAILCRCRDISEPAPKKIKSTKPKFYDINLKSDERQFLQQVIQSQNVTTGRINRARILLQVDNSCGTAGSNEIASAIGVRGATVYNICRRYRNEGIEAAINHKSLAGSKKT